MPLEYHLRMPRDVERTKRLAREAAIVEFAEHGEHGTTMERIAARAGVNKERIYSYFGDKSALFTSVVADEIGNIAEAVPLTIARIEDVGEYAGQTFDYLDAHPDLARLALWQGLADTGSAPDGPNRAALRLKVDAIAAAQREGLIDSTLDPAYLLFLLLALTSWWFALPQTIRLLTGADPADPREHAKRRAAVVDAAMRLARPQGPGDAT
jgi:AcrR family transcriptional regulator